MNKRGVIAAIICRGLGYLGCPCNTDVRVEILWDGHGTNAKATSTCVTADVNTLNLVEIHLGFKR